MKLPTPEETEAARPNRVVVFREVELPAGRLYPWAEMEVGECFWAPPHICSTKQFGARTIEGMEVARRRAGEGITFSTAKVNGRVLVKRVA